MPDDEKDEKEKWILGKIAFSFDFNHNLNITHEPVCVRVCIWFRNSMWNAPKRPITSSSKQLPRFRLLFRKERQNLLHRTKYAQENSWHSSDSYIIMYLLNTLILNFDCCYRRVYLRYRFVLLIRASSLEFDSAKRLSHIFVFGYPFPIQIRIQLFHKSSQICCLNVYLFSAFFSVVISAGMLRKYLSFFFLSWEQIYLGLFNCIVPF